MKRFGLASTAGIAMIVWSLLAPGKEGMYFFLAGAIVLSLTLFIFVRRSKFSKKAAGVHAATNSSAIAGATVGMFCGGFAGAWSGLGRMMIACFNPELSVRDFAALFGTLGGGMLGAFIGALLGAAFRSAWRRHSMAVHNEEQG